MTAVDFDNKSIKYGKVSSGLCKYFVEVSAQYKTLKIADDVNNGITAGINFVISVIRVRESVRYYSETAAENTYIATILRESLSMKIYRCFKRKDDRVVDMWDDNNDLFKRKHVRVVDIWDDNHVMSFEFNDELYITTVWFDKEVIGMNEIVRYLACFEGPVEYESLWIAEFINTLTLKKKLPLRCDKITAGDNL